MIEDFRGVALLDGTLEDVFGVNWEKERCKIIELAKLENKPKMQSLLQFAMDESVSAGMY